jgi:hypothetical protein
MRELHSAYEVFLDETSRKIVEEQKQLEQHCADQKPKPVSVNDLVLIRYPVRPPSKLHNRVAGPFRVVERRGNLVFVKDLTSDRVIERDAEMVIPFRQPHPMTDQELMQVAAQDLQELGVDQILEHRGAVTKSRIEFLVQWSDGETSWEPWKSVQKLAVLDKYLAEHRELKALTGRKTLGAV